MTIALPRKPRKRNVISIELHSEWKDKLKKLVSNTTSATRTDVVRRALSIYGALLDQQSKGFEVVLKKGDIEKLFPIN